MKFSSLIILPDSRLERRCLFAAAAFGVLVMCLSLATLLIVQLTGNFPFPGPAMPPIGMTTLASVGLSFSLTFVYVCGKSRSKTLFWLAFITVSWPLGHALYRAFTPVFDGTLNTAFMESTVSFVGVANRLFICLTLLLMLYCPQRKRLLAIVSGVTAIFLLSFNSFVLLGHIKSIPFLYDFKVSLPGTVVYMLFGVVWLLGTLPFPGLLSPILSPKPTYKLFTCLSLLSAVLLVALGIANIINFQPAFDNQKFDLNTTRFWYWQLSLPNVLIAVLISSLSLKLLKAYQAQELAKEALEIRVEERTLELNENQKHLQKVNVDLRALTEELSEIARVREYALEGVSRLDVNGLYVMVNATYAAMAGFSPDELIGESWHRTVSPDMWEGIIPYFEQMRETGKSQLEVKGTKKDGQEFFKEVVIIRQVDAGDNYSGHYCFAKDITERKRLEANLQNTLFRLKDMERLFSLSMDMICIVDFDGHFLDANPAFEQTLGYSPQEMKQALFIDFIHPEDKERTLSEYQEIIRGNRSDYFENRYRAKDGSYRWLVWTFSPDVRANKVYAAARDFTEGKQAEQDLKRSFEKLQEVERQRLTYIYALTHDLRTPLIAQRHALSMLQETVEYTDEESRSLASGLLRNNENLLDMVSRLLESYQYEDGKIPFSFEPIVLNHLLNEVAQEIQPLVSGRQAELKLDVPDDLPLLLADNYHLKRVFQNLIGNSMEHLPAQGGVIQIVAFADQERVKVMLQDNGAGIDPDLLPVLFERYLMGATRKRKIGSGLGLYICRLIIERHGGSIQADNQKSGGAMFTILLPKSPFEELLDVQPTIETFERHHR